MLKQEVVQYVYQHLSAGHSIAGIRGELARSYPEEDIEDAFEAVGVNKPFPTVPHHSHNLLARVLFILTIAVLAGLVLGLATYGVGKLTAKAKLIEDTKPADGSTLANPSPNSPGATPYASKPQDALPAQGPPPATQTSAVKTLAPPPAAAVPAVTAPQTPAPAAIPSTGFGRCLALPDQNAPDAVQCRAEEARKLPDMNACEGLADPRLYDSCSRAFFEQASQK